MYSWLTSIAAHALNISQLFITVLNSSFCQYIVYQDAHANLLTESTVTLNFLCNLIPVGKYCLYGNLLTSCPPCIWFICSFG